VSALLPPPDAATGHRERLLAGMAQAVREHGFHGVTVADVVRHARTSRRTYYEHFADREACLLALSEVVTSSLLRTIEEAASAGGTFTERLDRALGAYLGLLADDPGLVRACLQETPGVGPAGVARVRELNRRWSQLLVRLVDQARAEDPEVRALPPELAIVIAGGFRDLVVQTLDEGRDPRELQAVGRDLVRRLTAAA
jgi:AcrR family transcriptional regulator